MSDPYDRLRALTQSIPAVKQGTPTTCWAACLSWWGRAVKAGRPQKTQDEVFNMYAGMADSDLTMPGPKLAMLLRSPTWNAEVVFNPGRRVGPKFLRDHLTAGPAMVGYLDPMYPTTCHCNVIVAPTATDPDRFTVMEPGSGMFVQKSYGKFGTLAAIDFLLAWPRRGAVVTVRAGRA